MMVGLKTSSDSHQSSRREFNLVANSRLGLVLLLLLLAMAKNTRILWNVRLIALLATKTTISGRDWNLPQSKCVCVASHPNPAAMPSIQMTQNTEEASFMARFVFIRNFLWPIIFNLWFLVQRPWIRRLSFIGGC